MNKLLKICGFAAFTIGSAVLLVTGCKSAPELSKENAQALIQAQYDQQTPSGITISVDNLGLKQGLTAGYWKLIKVYPNQRWADYTLTPEGKKVLKLASGGDVIEWRPGEDGQAHFSVVTVAANAYKAKDVQDPQDETIPGADTSKSASYTESVNMTGVPQPLQDIAHHPGNKLSSKKRADFSYEGGAWKVHGIA